jgi:hypothetical protein
VRHSFSSRLLACAWAFAALVLMFGPARAENERVALIVGNAAYKTVPRLDNSVLDAKAVAAEFRRIGFKVVEGYDLSGDQMRALLSEFSNSLSGSGGAVVYYAGHGVSFDGENYLLPVDIDVTSPASLDLNAISITQILRQMHREERPNVIILDACRDNPFGRELAGEKYRGLMTERGLNKVEGELAHGALIAFASDPNAAAFDGAPGQHSPFSKALIDHLADVDVPVETAMQRVRTDVWMSTRKQQLPWVNTSIIGEFDLNPAPKDAETLLWRSAEQSNVASDYQAYLDAFPTGLFAATARRRIALLSGPAAVHASSDETKVAAVESGPETVERQLGLDLSGRKALQRRLFVLKYDVGPIDGAFGDQMRVAVKDWQKKRGFSPTGYFDAVEVAALKSDGDATEQSSVRSTRASPPIASKEYGLPRITPADRRPEAPSLRRCSDDPGCRRGRRIETSVVHDQRASSSGEPHAARERLPPSLDPSSSCQKGFHTVAAPTVSGFRCVQDGY